MMVIMVMMIMIIMIMMGLVMMIFWIEVLKFQNFKKNSFEFEYQNQNCDKIILLVRNGSGDDNVATYKEQSSSQHHQDLKRVFSFKMVSLLNQVSKTKPRLLMKSVQKIMSNQVSKSKQKHRWT